MIEHKLEGSIKYEVVYTDKSYEIRFDQGIENELAANMITREIVKFIKGNLMESVTQAKGKDLDLVKDRLGKITTTEYMLGMTIEQTLAEMLMENQVSAESQIHEMSAINVNHQLAAEQANTTIDNILKKKKKKNEK